MIDAPLRGTPGVSSQDQSAVLRGDRCVAVVLVRWFWISSALRLLSTVGAVLS